MKCFVALFALLAALSPAASQYVCNGRKSGGTIFTDVLVNDGTCILDNVAITGSIFHTHGNLVTSGMVNVSGSITAHGSGTVELFGQTIVNGVFSVSNFRGSTLIGDGARLGSVLVADTDVFEARGTMSSLSMRSTKVVNINGARILFGGLSIQQGLGDITLCGSEIRGGIMMLESQGSLIAVNDAGCAVNTIEGSIFVLKGVGNLHLQGAQVTAADLSVSEQEGEVYVKNSALSDVAIGGVKGDITFENVRTDSDAIISGNMGIVRVVKGNVQGDMRISGNDGPVNLEDTDFNNEDVAVHGNTGLVSIVGTRRLSIGVNENKGGVNFVNNNGNIVTVSNNQGGVLIQGNTLTGLTCVDNIGPVSSGMPGKMTNTVSGVRSGQCANI